MKYLTKYSIALLLLSVLFLTCCKSQPFPPSGAKAKQLKAQRKTLEEAKGEIKENWLSWVHGDWMWFKKFYNESLSEADVPNMTMVPIPIYRMDSVSFYNYTTDTDIANSLALETKKADYLVLLKDSAFVATDEVYYYPDGKWNTGGGYSGLFPGIANKYYTLYSQGIPFYRLHLYMNKSSYHYSWSFYDNGKEFVSIQSDGSEISLIQQLNAERDSMKEYYKKKQ